MAVRLGLGTVQFGLNYGVSNVSGQPSEDEVKKILACASAGGIDVIDTAAAYGDAESVLGRCLTESAQIRVVTKTIPLRDRLPNTDSIKWIRDGLTRSLKRLRCESVDSLLVHHVGDLLDSPEDGVYAELLRLKQEGLVRRIGFSAYSGRELDLALGRYDFDVVQLPMNAFDQRLLEGGQLQRLRARNIEVHVRSIFLQGLLLMDSSELPVYFNPIRFRLAAWRRFLLAHGLTAAQGALAFARSLNVDVILIGVENAAQLERNLTDFASANPEKIDFSAFAINDERFVNPSFWQLDA
jgi:aryl-alcohol dehydrogenase-like predicted oxidoreductase